VIVSESNETQLLDLLNTTPVVDGSPARRRASDTALVTRHSAQDLTT
jgi:hypothetical protein